MNENEEIFIVTDGCMWEANKQNSTYYPHAIEVVNERTGQVRYIKSGSRISFVEGEITEGRSQEFYNKTTSAQEVSEVPDVNEDKLQRTNSKNGSGKINKKKRDKVKSL